MSLSWFFGSKKKTSDTEPQQHTSGSDYIFVDKADLHVTNECSESHHHPALPYSLAPYVGMVSHTSTQSTVNACHQNFLSGVPFKLYHGDASLTLDAMNRMRMHTNEVLLHISQLNLKSFEYDFLVEKNVLAAENQNLG